MPFLVQGWRWFSYHPLAMLVAFVAMAGNSALIKKVSAHAHVALPPVRSAILASCSLLNSWQFQTEACTETRVAVIDQSLAQGQGREGLLRRERGKRVGDSTRVQHAHTHTHTHARTQIGGATNTRFHGYLMAAAALLSLFGWLHPSPPSLSPRFPPPRPLPSHLFLFVID